MHDICCENIVEKNLSSQFGGPVVVCKRKVAGSRPVSAINPRGALRTSMQSPAVGSAE